MEKEMIAYFCMEIALESQMPTYSGGLSVLAGDMLRSAADLGCPLVGVSLLPRKGYFRQKLGADGWQAEEPMEWDVGKFLKEMPQRVSVTLEGRPVRIRAWKYEIRGLDGFIVPVFFLDTDLPENSPQDRTLTHFLYGGDAHYRLCQEAILGIGGVRMLRVLGFADIRKFHINEGHASLLTLALLEERPRESDGTWVTKEDVETVRRQCVFTTHTPVPAGHDRFDLEMAKQVLGRPEIDAVPELFLKEGKLNMTTVGIQLSGFVNGVSKKHAEISRQMFAPHPVAAITNGVHAATWTAPPFQELFDKHLPGWRKDNALLKEALKISGEEIWQAHAKAKQELIDQVNQATQIGMDPQVFTIGFARRAAEYKRGDMLLRDPERLKGIVSKIGGLQILYAGKAHPNDNGGKEMIRRIFQASQVLREQIKIVYLENYDMQIAQRMTAGVDLWLNNPQPPLEASGTSGMKAALNGVPSFSVLDGWWIEGCQEGVTGWGMDDAGQSLYDKLEQVIVPMFYRERDRFVEVMRNAIAMNGSYFNTHRMLQEYIAQAYSL